MNKKGSLALLPEDATTHGKKLHFQGHGNKRALVAWDDPADWASWNIEMPAAGKFEIAALASAAKGTSKLEIEVAGQTFIADMPQSNSWDDYQVVRIGRFTLDKPGRYTVKARPHDATNWKPVNLGPILIAKKSD
jgi:hypothetical protein